VSRVACAHGRPFLAVYREPYALTLWSFIQIADHEWIDSAMEKFRDFWRSKLTNFAVCGPEKLPLVLQDLQVEVGLLPSPEESAAAAAQHLGPAAAAVAQMMAAEQAATGGDA
jgi:hypothetical protein